MTLTRRQLIASLLALPLVRLLPGVKAKAASALPGSCVTQYTERGVELVYSTVGQNGDMIGLVDGVPKWSRSSSVIVQNPGYHWFDQSTNTLYRWIDGRWHKV